MTGYTDETREELIKANKEGNALYLHLFPAEEYFHKMHEYAIAHVSPSAREELLSKVGNYSI